MFTFALLVCFSFHSQRSTHYEYYSYIFRISFLFRSYCSSSFGAFSSLLWFICMILPFFIRFKWDTKWTLIHLNGCLFRSVPILFLFFLLVSSHYGCLWQFIRLQFTRRTPEWNMNTEWRRMNGQMERNITTFCVW